MKPMLSPPKGQMSKRAKLILILASFSVADLIFSLEEFKLGLAKEANPILDYYYDQSVFSFIAIKLFLTAAACFLFFNAKDKPIVNSILYCLAGLYIMLTLYHIIGFLATA